MLGFATIDHHENDDAVSIWLTSRDGGRALHTNAVVMRRQEKGVSFRMKALAADRIVVLTPGSVVPSEVRSAQSLSELKPFVEATRALQEQIVVSIREYSVRNQNRSLVEPVFAPLPDLDALGGEADSARRALATANVVACAWTAWLETEEQRRRRTADAKGRSPWIMPEHLSDAALSEFPTDFAARMRPEPVK